MAFACRQQGTFAWRAWGRHAVRGYLVRRALDKRRIAPMKTRPTLTAADARAHRRRRRGRGAGPQLGGDDRHRRRRRPPAVAAAARRRGADLGPDRAGQGAHRGARPAREQGLRGHDQPGPGVVPQRAGAGGHARRRRADHGRRASASARSASAASSRARTRRSRAPASRRSWPDGGSPACAEATRWPRYNSRASHTSTAA